MTHRTAAEIEDARRYRGAGHLLSVCQASWLADPRQHRGATGTGVCSTPSGAGFTVAPRPTVRGLIDAEEQMTRIEQRHPSIAGTGPAS